VKVLIASDKFKGSLTSLQVADGLAEGMARVVPSLDVHRISMADGGDGTLDAALSAGFEVAHVTVPDPVGQGRVSVRYARRADTAIVELAEASGFDRLPAGLDPWAASTMATGLVVSAAIEAGCRDVVVGLGGSCSTDGGSGLLVGLGARVLDAEGRPVAGGAAGLRNATTLDLGELRRRTAGVRFGVASDVTNPLLGEQGAAAVFAPQKGASPEDVVELDQALGHWADLVDGATGSHHRSRAGAGAAGGTGFALLSVLDAEMRSGVDQVLDLVDFRGHLRGADLVITGEGSLDQQSLGGKVPVGVARASAEAGMPVVAVCGRNLLTDDELSRSGIHRVWALQDLQPDLDRCISDAESLIRDLGETLIRQLGKHSD
jgi:glycerate kinase